MTHKIVQTISHLLNFYQDERTRTIKLVKNKNNDLDFLYDCVTQMKILFIFASTIVLVFPILISPYELITYFSVAGHKKKEEFAIVTFSSSWATDGDHRTEILLTIGLLISWIYLATASNRVI